MSLLVVTSFAIGSLGNLTGTATAQQDTWWDENWEHKTELTITEQSGTDLSNYPVVTEPIDIGSASQSSIRVVNETSGETLDFAVRETSDGYELAFSVDVPASGTNDHIAVYYGNPEASSVAISWNQARYNFYDGFDDGTLHENWTVQSGDWVESDGTLRPNGNDISIARNLSQPLDQSQMPISWETRVIPRSTGSDYDIRYAYLRNATGDGHRVLFARTYQNSDDGVGVNIGWDSPDSEKLLTYDQFAVDDPLREELRLLTNGNIDAFVENEANGETGSQVYSSDTTYEYTQVRLHDHGGYPGAEWDYIRIRYDVNPEPSISVGTEQTVSTSPSTETQTAPPTQTATTTVQDSDGDGVPDSSDYAPRDSDVQDESDRKNEGTFGAGPGFTPVSAVAAIVLLSALAVRKRSER